MSISAFIDSIVATEQHKKRQQLQFEAARDYQHPQGYQIYSALVKYDHKFAPEYQLLVTTSTTSYEESHKFELPTTAIERHQLLSRKMPVLRSILVSLTTFITASTEKKNKGLLAGNLAESHRLHKSNFYARLVNPGIGLSGVRYRYFVYLSSFSINTYGSVFMPRPDDHSGQFIPSWGLCWISLFRPCAVMPVANRVILIVT